MKKIIVVTLLLLIINSTKFIMGQETPSDFVNQLPDIFTQICTANNTEVQSYSKMLGAFTDRVKASLDTVVSLKTRSQKTAKLNPNANTAALNKKLDKVKKEISTRDFSEDFYKATHNQSENEMQARLEEINNKISQTDDWKVMEELLKEELKVRQNYCDASASHFIDLLIQQRAVLKKDLSSIVLAGDLKQQLDCKMFGYIYIPAVSYERAYLTILDHLKYMHLLLGLAPGNE